MDQVLTIRKSGGASIVSLPKSALEMLGLSVGQAVEWSVKDHALILVPVQKETLASLLAGVTREVMKPTQDEREWMGGEKGKEIL